MYPHQTERLAGALVRGELDVVVATSPENVAYISGWDNRAAGCQAAAYAIYARGGSVLVLPAADVPGAVDDGVDVDHIVCYGEAPIIHSKAGAAGRRIQELVTSAEPDAHAAVAIACGLVGGDTIGLDESGLGPVSWRALGKALGRREPAACGELLADVRRAKAPFEIQCLERSLHIAEEALDAVIQVLDRGMTEREAATLYAQEVIKRGASPTLAIVAMGDRTSIPRPRASDRALRSGEVIRLDVGASHRGYCASVARTAVYGEPSAEMESTYGALQAGLDAAVNAARPGASAGSVVDAAIAAVREAGLEDYHAREIGHGIGLAHVEAPALRATGATTIEPGEVLCVAVPRYEIGSLGIVVRDTMLITTAGGRLINRSRHDLIVLD